MNADPDIQRPSAAIVAGNLDAQRSGFDAAKAAARKRYARSAHYGAIAMMGFAGVMGGAASGPVGAVVASNVTATVLGFAGHVARPVVEFRDRGSVEEQRKAARAAYATRTLVIDGATVASSAMAVGGVVGYALRPDWRGALAGAVVATIAAAGFGLFPAGA